MVISKYFNIIGESKWTGTGQNNKDIYNKYPTTVSFKWERKIPRRRKLALY